MKRKINDLLKLIRGLKRYISNTSWIASEKSASMVANFFLTILVARYLGPNDFGILAYAVSLTTLFAAFGHMGLGGLVVREIVKTPDRYGETLGTSFAMKTAGVFLAYLVLVAIAFTAEQVGTNQFWVLIIVASSVLFKPFDVIEFWFQAHVQAKYAAVARATGLLVSGVTKILLVFAGAELLLFAFPNILQALIIAIILVAFYHSVTDTRIRAWRVSIQKAKFLFNQGWIIFLASLFAVIYLKVDQIMLKWMVGENEVGVYAVAARLSEAWYFLPSAIVASLFPRLIALRESDPARYHYRLQQIFDLLAGLAICIAILTTIVAEPLIRVLFGAEYVKSASILVIHIWAAVFIFMRALFSKWILMEDALIFSLITQGAGAALNIILNMILIQTYGGYGAAVATLISYAASSYLSLPVYRKTRPVFVMMTRSLVSPIRYPYCYVFKAER